MIGEIATFVVTGLFAVLNFLISLLPSFAWPDLAGAMSSAGVSEFIGYLNWFFPVGQALTITTAWATALLAYNAYLFFADWLKFFIK